MTDLSAYKELYLKTAYEYLTALQTNLPVFIKSQSDLAVLEVLHRSAHSLKSQSLVMGYKSLGELSKEIEYIFRNILDNKVAISEELRVALADSFQKIYDSLESIKSSDKEADLTSEKEKLMRLSGITSD